MKSKYVHQSIRQTIIDGRHSVLSEFRVFHMASIRHQTFFTNKDGEASHLKRNTVAKRAGIFDLSQSLVQFKLQLLESPWQWPCYKRFQALVFLYTHSF